ncbi:FAD-dependent oxidoreductase [Roseateles depolymerans]|uniref:FAD-dependent oxidoreductase n=1 Tax=Roseateles depolymerans TaxID=76731 RepID=A0A0U3MNU2_9BURK|nr:FAD-dependent oxidoreductase [Roseateles depolymerans]ALV06026.1 FAD-dependent oxidoreductase [Roseateles depolymerans]REG11998.1 3-(3-hydroxy-phenyl)propionate hydroxylase [Roseateles depolymerans]
MTPPLSDSDLSPSLGYRRHADQDAAAPVRRPVVVVGAGPVGLSLAIDLALQQVPVVLLNNDGRLSVGSRALCFAKRTLEIFDRLGCGEPIVGQGVSWHVGRVFFRDQQVYQFDLLPEAGHRRPAFINLSQHDLEAHLVARAAQLPLLDLRWHHAVVGLDACPTHARLTVRTPEGDYLLDADHVVACDGSRSPLRGMLGLDTQGRSFRDRFLIADVRMRAPFPAERWFWFDPPFHPGQSVLLHRQPDGVWRIDFQLGWDADPEQEKRPENILPRVQALMAQASRAAGGNGEIPEMELVWASVYTFACQRMERFRHGRVLFAGDAAHGVSPFGARGANSGIQDADNLAWKLAWVIRGQAPESLLETYAREREVAADDNIRHSTRSTDFITPKSAVSRLFRTAVLDLAKDFEFARKLVNSGRLSLPTTLVDSSLNTEDGEPFGGVLALGAPMVDAPVALVSAAAAMSASARTGWLLDTLVPGRFSVVMFLDVAQSGSQVQHMLSSIGNALQGQPATTVLLLLPPDAADVGDMLCEPTPPGLTVHLLRDLQGLAQTRCDAQPGTVLLLRPDQHLCARWRRLKPELLRDAMLRAAGLPSATMAKEELACH